ncbi:AMP-binding protein [Acinetobacter sp. AS23]|uniref:class I adenylate-forming enzyme family protein n=1 Tax=Acinetobacter sp. AS23 TaxID=2871688 RepID=UPI0020263AE4|nr:AMP-binding protein [Acinetobacter sp. AS23]URM41971.1 AMP-binding protein [Acinetobacter sp. AS23]
MKMDFSWIMQLLAQSYGDQLALVNVERNRRFSYKELHLVTNRIANMLRDTLQVKSGDKLLSILDNDNLSLMHLAASFKQEGTLVFTNYRDSLEEHTWQVELIKPRVVFLETANLDRYYDMLRLHGCQIIVMDSIVEPREGVHDFWALLETSSSANTNVELDTHDHLALMRFTGGTTGRGKCAMYSMDNLLSTCDSVFTHSEFGISKHTRFLHFAPLSHGSMLFYLATLFAGGTTYTQNLPDLVQWRRVVESEGITHSFLVPTLLYRLLDMQRSDPRDLSSLKTIVYGAAPMSPTKLSDLVECFGSIFVQGYAATELVMFISTLSKYDHRTDNETSIRRLSSAGRVSPGVAVYIVDETGRPLPLGETGEIMIRCRGVIKGYYQNPEGNAEFVNGAWKSGDLGYIDDDGYLFIVDRKKDMIISGGFNIYAVEVEAALASHPAVLMSAVVGIPHEEWGEAVHAEVVLRSGCQSTVEELIEHVKNKLGRYKAPKSISLVDQLPVSTVGKVIRRIVKDKYWRNSGRKVN